MTIIEILDQEGVLGDIRQRLGASDEFDTSKDNKISRMDARELTAVCYGWELGDDTWGYSIIDLYENLKKEIQSIKKIA